MVSWSTIQSLLLFFGPLLLPKLLSFYRSIRSRPASSLKPLAPTTSYALTTLFISGLLSLLSTLPIFSPENIFRITKSRLQTPAGVLMTRLASIRDITPQDHLLYDVFDAGGLEARLLYARYGPEVLTTCPFATPGERDAGRDYLFYALPTLLAPHLLHLFALGIATATPATRSWRVPAIIAGLVLGVAEVWLTATYDDTPNLISTRVNEISFPFWTLPVLRSLAIATVDGLLGWILYLSATGRAFTPPPDASQRLLDHGKGLEALVAKTRSLGVLRNGSVRDQGLRGRVDGYWVREGEVMKDVFEQPEVLEAQRGALRRVDLGKVGREAGGFVDAMFGTGGAGDVRL